MIEAIDAGAIATALEAGRPVRLAAEAWARLEGAFPLVARHDTRLRGHLSVYGEPEAFLVVEEPSGRERVVRRVATREDVDRFVADRLEAYERMWDGCGVRIDYDR